VECINCKGHVKCKNGERGHIGIESAMHSGWYRAIKDMYKNKSRV